jgi:predicted dehydrogenase
MASRIRAGIIGAGFMGSVHAHAVRAAGGTVTRVAVSDATRAEEAAALLGAAQGSRVAYDLIADDQVDVVHICTPNSTHAALAEAALEAGKPVVCEKPLATSVSDATRLVELADSHGMATAVPFVYRYYPTVREARARIEEGQAGRLWLLHGSYLQDWLSQPGDNNWRVDPAQGGDSRAFGDIGVHWCDLMEFTTGHRITRLAARTLTAHPQRDGGPGSAPVATEDGALVLFETDEGATGSVVISQASAGRKNRLWFSFDGTNASYEFNQEQPDSLWVGGRQASTLVPRGAETESPEAHRYSRLPAGHPQGYQDCFNAFVRDAYSAMDGGKPEGLPTFADGRRAAVITQTVLESAREQTWIEVPK